MKGGVCSALHLLMTTGLTVCSFAFHWLGCAFEDMSWLSVIGVQPGNHSLVDLGDGVVDVVEECLHRSLILSTQNTALLLPITGASKSCQLQHVALRQSTHSIRRCT